MKNHFSLRTFLHAALIEGVVAFIWLLLIPSEGGMTGTRLMLIAAVLLPLAVTAFYTLKANKNSEWNQQSTQKMAALLREDGNRTNIFFLSLIGTFGSGYIIYTALATTNLHTQGYLLRLAPLVFWVGSFSLQMLFFLRQQEPAAWIAYLKKHGLAIMLLLAILSVGFVVHNNLGNPKRPASAYYSPVDNLEFDIEEQDIFLVYKEGLNLLQGNNPYARAEDLTQTRWNSELPTYLPLIYYGSWLTHRAGLQELDQWLNIWRGIFLGVNLLIAYTLFHLGHHRFNSTTLAVFGALFWLFNRWTLHVTMIYHFNFIPIFFFLLALILYPRHKIAAYILFGISLGVKHNAIFFLPIFLIWAWREASEQRIKNVVIAGLAIASVPFLASLPLFAPSPLGFIKSLLISLTRFPETHMGVLSLDALMGWVGLPAKIPLLTMVLLIYVLAWKRKLRPFAAGLLIMLIFVDFHSVLFRHYMAWVIPLLPLVIGETFYQEKELEQDFCS